MAKRGRPKGPDRDDVTTRIERSLNRKLKLLAGHRGVSVAEVLSELARAPINKAYAGMLHELDDAEAEGEKKGKG